MVCLNHGPLCDDVQVESYMELSASWAFLMLLMKFTNEPSLMHCYTSEQARRQN